MDLKNARFENLPRSTQLIIMGVLAVGLAGVVYMLYLKDMIAKRERLQTDVAKLEETVARGNAVKLQLSQFKKELAELDARLDVLRKILPNEKETPVVLERVQDMAAASNLKIMKFTPQGTVPRAFYVDWPIQMTVEGSYDGLGRFFSKISESTRIINVDSITIKGIDGSKDPARTLSATCTATTFMFREEAVPPLGN
jgi:type IV pilus assembly protein PilO